MPIEHWMTFATFSEQEFFTYPSVDTYHGVILNGNMVAHAPDGIAAFLMGKVSPKTCFAIDPMTHAFQHNPQTISNENGPKSSIRKLAAQFGKFIVDGLGQRPIDAATVTQNIDEFTSNVVNFQWQFLESRFQENGDAKYLDDDEKIRRPSLIVAPYFYLTEDNLDEWLPVMRDAGARTAALCINLKPGVKAYSALVINRSILQVEALINRVVDDIGTSGISGVLLWVDEFDEAVASILELSGLSNLCARLRGHGLDVLNIHGGYFSCLLGADSFGNRLTGVSHGPEFGESRGVVPVGGGIPISRFYVPQLHLREKFRDFLPIALRKGWLSSAKLFHAEVCNCMECQKTIDGDPNNFVLYGESDVKSIKRKHGVVRIEFPTTEAKKRCLRHYLNKKKAEFLFVSTSDKKTLLNDLTASHTKFADAGSRQSSHLDRWKRVLEKI